VLTDISFRGDFSPFFDDRRVDTVEWYEDSKLEKLSIAREPATLVAAAVLIKEMLTLDQDSLLGIQRVSVKSVDHAGELTWVSPKFACDPRNSLPGFEILMLNTVTMRSHAIYLSPVPAIRKPLVTWLVTSKDSGAI
jgi:hypothetical protein